MNTAQTCKKKREILFAKFPPGQVPEAADDLKHLEELEVQPKLEKRAVGRQLRSVDSTRCANSTIISSTRASTSTTR